MCCRSQVSSLLCVFVLGDVLQNEANEFFIGFGNNLHLSGKSDLIMSVVTSNQDTVRFTVDTLSDFTYSGNVSLSSPAKVVLPLDFMVTDDSSSQRRKGIHVKAEENKTIAVFGFSYSDDAYLALPCNHLPVQQYEYYAVTYDLSFTYKPFVLLVGCENSTTITTVVSKFTLNRLETYLISEINTGARFISDKPITFLSGHQLSEVTNYVPSLPSHLVEQLPPASIWGTFFLGSTGELYGQYGDTILYRILAAYDETEVIFNCNSTSAYPTHYTISIGGTYHDFTFDLAALKTLCVIEASNPVLVTEFLSINGDYGWKPFMSLLPPVDQYNNHYTLPAAVGNLYQYVTISVLPQYFDQKKIYMDDSIVSKPWTSVKCSNGTLCGYATTVSAGRFLQHLDSDAKIGAILFGVGTSIAYGCPAGFHVGSINQCT